MTNRSDRGSNKPRGAERFERDDVIRDPIRGLHQGQQPCGAARTGRTHGCTRPVLVATKNALAPQGSSTHGSTTTSLHSYARAGAVHHITSVEIDAAIIGTDTARQDIVRQAIAVAPFPDHAVERRPGTEKNPPCSSHSLPRFCASSLSRGRTQGALPAPRAAGRERPVLRG
jgi:hypothetical protein